MGILNKKSAQFVLPGIFLLILGLGNIGVGTFKEEQYDEVLAELSEPSQSQSIEMTPLKRIQSSEQIAVRAYQRKKAALGRRDFYRLVAFGGRGMVVISLVLLLAGSGIEMTLRRIR